MAAKPRTPGADDRGRVLAQQRNLKMSRSAHAYVRGNTLKFYEWLEAGDRALPDGPPVWICGDCHLGNLGPLADAEGRVDIQIRDLDQTVIGNPAHDLIRLGLSLATAARGSDLPGVTTAQMIEEMVAGYAQALDDPPGTASIDDPMPDAVRAVIAQAMRRTWKHLARERIEDGSPTIPLGKRFWALSAEEKAAIHELFEAPALRSMVTGLLHRREGAEVIVHDAAYWMKGCSSLGRQRFAVLLEVRGGGRRRLGLVDIKEAAQAAAPRADAVAMPRDNAERVVTGACAIAPYLGERMRAARLLGRSVVVRELMPQDLKLEIDQLSRAEATKAARFLAGVVGRAHGRQMDGAPRRRWRADVSRNTSTTLNAPSWLWASVVDLVAAHESAYLEHCRRYALAEAA
jgi:uncharacterized protein (DUF2252 family)